jgi:GAF domain-containing protein
LNAEDGQEHAHIPSSSPLALATPLKLRDEVIGVLGLHAADSQRSWTEDEIALIESVSEQMALAIENARLFEDSQRSAWRDQVVSETTAKVWSSAEIEEVLKTAVAQLGDKLRASEVVIRLGTEAELTQE